MLKELRNGPGISFLGAFAKQMLTSNLGMSLRLSA
jgi:hypothetical protein